MLPKFPLLSRPPTLAIFSVQFHRVAKVSQDLSAEFFFNVSYFLKNEEKENIKCVVQLLGMSPVLFSQ